MDYVEDWDVLLQMLAKGASFMPLFETHAEIRLIGDGNATFKKTQCILRAAIIGCATKREPLPMRSVLASCCGILPHLTGKKSIPFARL